MLDGGRKQHWLAARLGVSYSVVDRMLGGGHVPKERTLKTLAEIIGVRVEDLLIPKCEAMKAG